MMPRMGGFGLLREVKAHPTLKALPFIFLSARAGEESAVEGLEAGADDYLIKPFGARELLARVEGALRLARERSERERMAVERADFERYLIGIVSHDLRNPLSVINLSSSVLLRRANLEERLHKSLERIAFASGRAQRMIRDLLDFTKARLGGHLPVNRAPLDFHTLARQVVDELRESHPERTVHLEQQGDGEVTWDGDRVAQVLGNLLSNALNYSPPDTPVRVRTVGTETEGILEIHNEGTPISPELLPRLFQPLQRGASERDNAASRSVGLGLYIVEQLTRAHGGQVEVRSQAGEGTTFRVALPRTGSSGAGPTA